MKPTTLDDAHLEYLKKEKAVSIKYFLIFFLIAMCVPIGTFISFTNTPDRIDWKNLLMVVGIMYSPIYVILFLLYKNGYKIPGINKDIRTKQGVQIEATITDAFSANFQPKFDFFRNPRKKPYYLLNHEKYKKIYVKDDLFKQFNKGDRVKFTIAVNTGLALNIESIK
ncbi:MAG: hypothetical protein NZ529_07030 [Cytophagaceae bacterium]|nr:hypothetical protein [Cytophagaceae bacterium]MDW8456535.1 hypothetical protein [Cytophagaceae bacterium]